jgi:hypothetical protein
MEGSGQNIGNAVMHRAFSVIFAAQPLAFETAYAALVIMLVKIDHLAFNIGTSLSGPVKHMLQNCRRIEFLSRAAVDRDYVHCVPPWEPSPVSKAKLLTSFVVRKTYASMLPRYLLVSPYASMFT